VESTCSVVGEERSLHVVEYIETKGNRVETKSSSVEDNI
jgi:hypothetical protein